MKGKIRNQRISNSRLRKQQHLLEVTVRADKARVMRNRMIAGLVVKTVLFVGIATGLYVGSKELLRRFVWENPDYFLSDIRVSSDGALQRDQILDAGEVKAGVNIFTVDCEQVRAGIDKLPQVERAEIQRVLPNRLEITITERRPVAWVTERADENPTASEQAWLIDARGVVMKTKRMLEEYYHLPHISGVPVANFVPGQRVYTVEMQSALELIRLDGDNTRWQARNIDLSKGYCLLVTDQNHAKITFGLDGIDQQIDRLFRYLDRADAEKKELRTVNLIVRKNTPVTFQDPALEEPQSAAPPAPVAEKAKPKETDREKEKQKDKEFLAAKPAVPVARAVPVATPLPSGSSSGGSKSSTSKSGNSKSRSDSPKSDTRSGSRTKSNSLRKPFRP